MQPTISLAPGADSNGFAVMLSDLVRQNLESKPHKMSDLRAIGRARVALVADDADVALTLVFDDGVATVHDGIRGIPDVTIRAESDTVLAMSNMPLSTPLRLPIAPRNDPEARAVADSVMRAMRKGTLKIYGGIFHPRLLLHLTRVMSVNG